MFHRVGPRTHELSERMGTGEILTMLFDVREDRYVSLTLLYGCLISQVNPVCIRSAPQRWLASEGFSGPHGGSGILGIIGFLEPFDMSYVGIWSSCSSGFDVRCFFAFPLQRICIDWKRVCQSRFSALCSEPRD